VRRKPKSFTKNNVPSATVRTARVRQSWEKKAGVKDYTDAKVQAEIKDDAAFKAIKEGIQDGDKIKMKPAEGLSDSEIKALIAYMRAFKT